MSAVQQFAAGQVVALTSHAVRSGLKGRASSLYGCVVRVMPNGYLRIRREGIKHAQRYAASWWRPLTTAEARARKEGT